MELLLTREKLGDVATLGRLAVDGLHECVTLEDPVREIAPDGSGKVQGNTAIPAGRYRVVIADSPRLTPRTGHQYMRLLDVPHFTGILIHSGNTPSDTQGCILVGQQVEGAALIRGGSTSLPRLQAKVQDAIDRGEPVWITIKEARL